MIQAKDKLVVEMHGVVNEESHAVLTMLYLPLIKQRAYMLYEIFVSLCTKNMKFENHLIIQKISGLSMEAIEEERKTLERYQLLKTYYDATSQQYLYIVLPPLKGLRFLEHEVFGRLYVNELGEDVVKFQKKHFLSSTVDKDKFTDISECISDVLQDNWSDDFEQTYLEVKQEIQKSKQEQAIIFNYDEFLNDLSNIVWPKKNRTKKNLDEVGKIATVYGVSPKQMRILIGRCVKDGKLDIQDLRRRAVASKAKYETKEVNVYKWPPIRFLQEKQNGVPVSKHDAETIRMLLEDYRLIPEVCNVLIEYVLATSDHKFIRNYVESIAASWVRASVDTYEKAVERISTPTSAAAKAKKQKTAKVEEDKLSDEERQRLLDEINKMRGK